VEFKTVVECDTFAKDTKGVYIIKWGANYCAPCKMLDVALDKMLAGDSIQGFTKIDMDVNPEVLIELGVTSIPYSRMYLDGEFKGAFNGVLNATIIFELLHPKPREESVTE